MDRSIFNFLEIKKNLILIFVTISRYLFEIEFEFY